MGPTVAIKDFGEWEEHSASSGFPHALAGERCAPGTRTTNPKRVLVVEDNVDSACSLALLLHEMGHESEYVVNGYAGLSAVKTFRPHVVLLDLGLPGMSGFQFLAQLKYLEEAKSARVIVITAYNNREDRQRSRALGCEVHLVKPVPPDVLEELLK
jgi:two-component system, OmpR family, response regulator